jgi:hypothetical protein
MMMSIQDVLQSREKTDATDAVSTDNRLAERRQV